MTSTHSFDLSTGPDALSLTLHGVLDLQTTPDVLEGLGRIPRPLPKVIRVDMGGVTRMDDCGALVIMQLRRMADVAGAMGRLL